MGLYEELRKESRRYRQEAGIVNVVHKMKKGRGRNELGSFLGELKGLGSEFARGVRKGFRGGMR